MKIRELELNGSYYDMGFQHGTAYKKDIIAMTKSRVELSMDKNWTGRELSKEKIFSLAEACIVEHKKYSPELMEESKGMAAATGLSVAELIIAGGFTDFIDLVYNTGDSGKNAANPRANNCTAFLIPKNKSANKQGYYGQTWDMHESARDFVILLKARPNQKPNFLAFTTMGCLGMIGLNEHGISVGINNISVNNGQVGVTWPFVVRKILEQNSLEDALKAITSAKLAGAHNYLIMDGQSNAYNVEALPDRVVVSKLEDEAFVHTNHCLYDSTKEVERERVEEMILSSDNRFDKAKQILNKNNISLADLQALTAEPGTICETSKAPYFVETCGAAIIQPATRKFWAVWGKPSQNEYEEFSLSREAN